MPDFTPERSDAIRAGLIDAAARDLHGAGAAVTSTPAASDETGAAARPARERTFRPQWAAAAIALLLVGGLTGAAIAAAFNVGRQTAAVPTPAPSSSPSATAEAVHGDIATWQLVDPAAVSAESVTLQIAVMRLGCASGVTGEVLRPQVSYTPEYIVIQVDVAPFGEGVATCQGNDAVPVTVQLGEPIGDRTLIDGGCSRIEADATSACLDARRWHGFSGVGPVFPEGAEFTRDELIDLCLVDARLGKPAPATETVHRDQARVERRSIDPRWFVYVPTTDTDPALAEHELAYMCIYGGTPQNPEKGMYGGTVALTEDEIQFHLRNNESLGE